ncbi:hypothetical protein OAF54_00635 [bacterium]|nr:hypothetical protein [bacterium]
MSRYTDAVRTLRRKVELKDTPLKQAIDETLSEMTLGLAEVAELETAATLFYGGLSEG